MLCLTSVLALARDSGSSASRPFVDKPSPRSDEDKLKQKPLYVPQQPLYSVNLGRPPSLTAYTAYDDGHVSTYRPDEADGDRLAPVLERDGTAEGSRYGTEEDHHGAASPPGHYASSDAYRVGYQGQNSLSPPPNALSPQPPSGYALSPGRPFEAWPDSMASPRPAPRPPVVGYAM